MPNTITRITSINKGMAITPHIKGLHFMTAAPSSGGSGSILKAASIRFTRTP